MIPTALRRAIQVACLSACALALTMASSRASIAASSPVARSDDPSLVTGTVIDARTRAPLSRYLLELRSGTRFDRVTSDEHGHFTSAIAFPPGDIAVRPVDDDSVARVAIDGGLDLFAAPDASIAMRFAGAPLEVVVPVGPMIRLAWKPAAVEGAPTTGATALARLVCVAKNGVDEGLTLSASLRLESDGSTWVRFAPLPPGVPACAGSTRLRIVTADGKWMAIADGGPAFDAAPQTLELAWRPCARWIGALDDNKGRGVPGTWIALERVDDTGAVHERRRSRCDPNGGYAFEGLEPARWRLSGEPLRFHSFQSQPRDLPPGETSKLTVTLDPERTVGSINGRIDGAPVVAGEAAPLEAAIIVRRAGESLPQDTLRAAWRVENGRYVALFIVAAVPIGEYDLELVPPARDPGPWAALTLRVKAGDTAVFTRR
jgi:hypothetical protein